MTGTVACSASSASVSSLPVRSPIAATWRDSTSAVSRADSPRESCISAGRSTIGCPPSSTIPTSNDVRVRVEGFSNSSATVRPSSAREAAGAALSARARSSSCVSSVAESSSPVRRWRGKDGSLIHRRRHHPSRPGRVSRVSAMRVLTWNLFHGRSSRRPAGRCCASSRPRWPAGRGTSRCCRRCRRGGWVALSEAAGADGRGVYTSRNTLLPARRALAMWIPDVVKSEGGGANAILVRGRVKAHRWVELTREPERRVAHGVALEDGRWVANLHASLRPPERVRADAAATLANARAWAAGAHLVVGGDFNWRRPELPGLQRVASHWVDHIFAPDGAHDADVLDAGPLSDHRPVAVTVE